ncbi:MAG: hypothetical protein AB8B63_21435 [Granulosicoccus sp.]
MRNYFKRLNLPPLANEDAIERALDDPESQIPADVLADARTILLNRTTRKTYQRTFAQYEALCTAKICVDIAPGLDTNHWHERLSNFDPDLLAEAAEEKDI